MQTTRRVVLVLVSLTLLAGAAACDWPAGTRYVDTVFTDLDATTNVVYRQTTRSDGTPVDLKIDLYQPRGDTTARRPAVMWMFGGGWVFGDKNQMTSYAQDSARRGYVGITIDYRTRPGGTGSDTIGAAYDAYDDAVAAVAWIKAHAAQYRIDPNLVIAGGYSAGAINAMNLLFLPGTRGPATSPVAGGVAIAGLSFAAPTPGRPPAIMHQGTADTVVPPSAAQRTCTQTRQQGNICEYLSYEGVDHLIAFTRLAEVQANSARLILERILIPHWYGASAARSTAGAH